ncbi:MAG: hypothetical protein HGB12_01630 [Bacteroidetes bacterium]|nr:hypothetical protein [Bacteroidota bacterium]
MKINVTYLVGRSIIFALLTFNFQLLTFNSYSQGIAINVSGDSAANSAILDVQSDTSTIYTSQGILIPRMRTAKRPASPAEGLLIYNTSTNCLEIYVGPTWQSVVCGCISVPSSSGIISGTPTVCPGQSAVLYSVPAINGATSYNWSYSGSGASIIGSTNSVIVYFSGTATSGNLTVMGTNACGNGSISSDYPITINSTAPNITGQPENPAAVCAGSGSPSFTVIATGGLTYQWQEFIISWNNVANAGVYSNVTTSTLTITNPPASMNTNKYRCIVSGTCTNTTSDGLATLSVNPVPSVTNSTTATICSGTSPNITLTSSVPSNFEWTIGTITGNITGASSGSGTTINQTLTNPSNATAGTVQYLVTPTSTTGSCTGAAFIITVTVNPTPTVTNTPLAQTICTGGNTTLVTLTSNVIGTAYAWTASPTAGITGYTAIGSNTIPIQAISNSGSTAGTVTYTIIPTANTCSGAAANYVTTVNPLPTSVTAIASPTSPVCSGSTLTLAGNATNATTWVWAGPNSFNSTLQSPTIASITATGAGTYSLTASNSCGSAIAVNTNLVTIASFGATGGTITYTDASGLNPRTTSPYSGGYTVHTFTSNGTFTPNCSGNANVAVLVVAGGGGGGAGRTPESYHGGGGGGGGLIYDASFNIATQTYTITVGTGGTNGSNGSNSIFSSLTAIGGGSGGIGDNPGNNGGSGGGAGVRNSIGGTATAGQGNNGGSGRLTPETPNYGAGGGGGAGAAGNGGGATYGGNGGNGLQYSISGTSTYYAGGGGGSTYGGGTPGTGGLGGGGNGAWGTGSQGAANTGGGGGGSDIRGGGNGFASGGSGIVIIRYPN